MITDKLIIALDKYQKQAGLSTCKLAHKVGLNFTTLYRIKAGERGAGTKVLRALSQILELRGAINEFISSGNTPPASHQTSLSQKIRGARGKVIQWVLSKVG